jgi:hypothetical protein
MTFLYQEKIDFIVNALRKIKYGSLLITIHDGQIIQVDSTERNGFGNTKNKTVKKKPLQY